MHSPNGIGLFVQYHVTRIEVLYNIIYLMLCCTFYVSMQAFYWQSHLWKSECFTCGVEYSRNAQTIQLQEIKKLDEYVSNWEKMRLAVPRDNHCILYAFILGLQEVGTNNTIEELFPKIKREVLEILISIRLLLETQIW